jgi:antitoxin VapB
MYHSYMAFHVSNPEVDEHVRALAELTGKTITEAIDDAVMERLRFLRPRTPDPNYVEDLMRMAAEIRVHLKPGIRSTDDLVGYDEDGLPR